MDLDGLLQNQQLPVHPCNGPSGNSLAEDMKSLQIPPSAFFSLFDFQTTRNSLTPFILVPFCPHLEN
jgi:hypothetical protein